jgi:predicted PurR-regulated permease PerM
MLAECQPARSMQVRHRMSPTMIVSDDKTENVRAHGGGDMAASSSGSLKLQSGALRWGAILFTIAAGLMIWPLWQPLVLAIWFAIFARPLMKKVSRITHGRHRAAAVLTVLLLLLVLVPVGIFVASLVSAATELFDNLLKSKGGKRAFEAIVSGGSAHSHKFVLSDLVPLTKEYGERAFGLATSIAGATAKGILGIFVFVLAAYSFLAEGREVYAWIENHLPITPRNFRRYADAFAETGRGLVVGVGLTGLIQGITATVAYLALGIPRALVLGVLTAAASLIPSVGTGLVWCPVAVGLALTGHWGRATIMIAIGLFVIGMADNLLRPLLSRYGSVQLPTFVLLVAMFGGLATVGAWGLLLGPLLVRLAVEAVSIEHDERVDRSNAAAPPPATVPHA